MTADFNMNHLQNASSPYLLQHAHNPVNWYPWGEEALERARTENKPVLVSIGYSTCHWCHVMERESFEDADIAAYMNEHFINIKVDREERPDLDQLYMEACEVLTGQGGWPLNIFLTPELRPFFAGTYFPPEASGRRMSWSQALQYALYNFRQNRSAVERQADRVQRRLELEERETLQPVPDLPAGGPAWVHTLGQKIAAALRPLLDEEGGGFGAAPKFPNTTALEFLLHCHWHSGEEWTRSHALFTLDRMLAGGIYDQLGGGFARYAVDRHWRIPHFEKMLYDNALLSRILVEAFRLTGKEFYRLAAEETLDFVLRELTGPEGAFYAALDADSEGREGAFYLWSEEEVTEVLGQEAPLFCDFYQISREGNWEGTNILWRPETPETFAQRHGMDPRDLNDRLAASRRRLRTAREIRPRPHRDEKILLSWNALMVSAFIHAYLAFGRETFREAALNCLSFLLEKLTRPQQDGFYRSFFRGLAHQPAFLDDYAFLIGALTDAYSLDWDGQWLHRAAALMESAIPAFTDEQDLLFYFAPGSAQSGFLRRLELSDGETPSANAAMADNLDRLGLLFDRREWRNRAARMRLALRETVKGDPLTYASWATGLLAEIHSPLEIAVVGPKAPELARQIRHRFLPSHVLMATQKTNNGFPLLQNRESTDETLIYLCRNYTCHRPVKEVEELIQLLNQKH